MPVQCTAFPRHVHNQRAGNRLVLSCYVCRITTEDWQFLISRRDQSGSLQLASYILLRPIHERGRTMHPDDVKLLGNILFYWTLLTTFGWLTCPFIGLEMGAKRNAGRSGFLLGLLFGPIGCILTAFIDCRPPCPACGMPVTTREKNKCYRICPQCRIEYTKPTEPPIQSKKEDQLCEPNILQT